MTRRSRLDRGIVRTPGCRADEVDAQAPRLRSPLVLRCIEDYLAGHRAVSRASGSWT